MLQLLYRMSEHSNQEESGMARAHVEPAKGEFSEEPAWQHQVLRVLKQHNVKHVVYVPDAGHSAAIRAAEADPDIRAVVLTSEQEGIGYLAGAWLAGERGALLMQSSGVGNCINTLALQVCARFPLLMLVTMRGDWAEFNAWQNPMGQATEPALRLMNVLTWRADNPNDVAPLIHGAATMAFNGDSACAVLLGQRLIGEKQWVK
jgi:sulfopyruvate decarboxylase alpha subunit